MFGLTLEKLVLVGIVAAVVIGPQRLPLYTQRLADHLRALRRFVEQTRIETGMDGHAYDPRRLDPRRVLREAWQEASQDETQVESEVEPAAASIVDPAISAQVAQIRPGQRYLSVGDAAHPRRLRLDTLPVDDPRRRAAQPEDVTAPDLGGVDQRP